MPSVLPVPSSPSHTRLNASPTASAIVVSTITGLPFSSYTTLPCSSLFLTLIFLSAIVPATPRAPIPNKAGAAFLRILENQLSLSSSFSSSPNPKNPFILSPNPEILLNMPF